MEVRDGPLGEGHPVNDEGGKRGGERGTESATAQATMLWLVVHGKNAESCSDGPTRRRRAAADALSPGIRDSLPMPGADPNTDLTGALAAYAGGDRSDVDGLMRAVYARLHELATESLRREGRDHTLQPTALVHEAYLRLTHQSTPWRSRAHFYAIAAHAMRRVLVDHARARDSAKRGGGWRPTSIERDDLPDPRGADRGDRLDILATLVQAYEARHFPIDAPDPVEAIRFRMEQSGLSVKDLEPLIGKSNRVYEVLSRKRPLTLAMIRRLHHGLGIPAEALIAEPAGG